MEPLSSALDELRQATRTWHDRLEAELPVAGLQPDRVDYLYYLQDLYGWLQPFEDDLWAAPWPDELQAGQRGGKLAWIESDLRHLQLDEQALAALPRAGFQPVLTSLPARLGLAYVLEGAQLGIQVLHKRLAAQFAPWEPRWLQGYGAQTGRLWRQFATTAERHLATPAARTEAAEAATAAFASLAGWFEAGRLRRQGTKPDVAPQRTA